MFILMTYLAVAGIKYKWSPRGPNITSENFLSDPNESAAISFEATEMDSPKFAMVPSFGFTHITFFCMCVGIMC
jgi:hypothetical protein